MPEIFPAPSQAQNVYPIDERWGQHPWEGPYAHRIPMCLTTLPPTFALPEPNKKRLPILPAPGKPLLRQRHSEHVCPKASRPGADSSSPSARCCSCTHVKDAEGGALFHPTPSAMTPAHTQCDRRRGGQTSLASANYRAYTQRLLRAGKTLSPPSIHGTNTHTYLDGGDSFLGRDHLPIVSPMTETSRPRPSSGATVNPHTHTRSAPESSLCPPISARIPIAVSRAKTFDLGLSPVLARIPKKHAREAR